jgi:hypothetical protein
MGKRFDLDHGTEAFMCGISKAENAFKPWQDTQGSEFGEPFERWENALIWIIGQKHSCV